MATADFLMVAGAGPDGAGIAQSLALAQRLGAHLTGAFLRPDFPLSSYGADGAWVSEGLLQRAIEAHDRAVDIAQARGRTDFLARAAQVGVSAAWVALDTADQLIARARLSDLVIAPASRFPEGGEVGIDAGELGLSCGRPVVVVADAAPARSIASRVMICWNGTRESARAWRDAWPIILAADDVALAIVRPTLDFDDVADLRFRLSRWDRRVATFVDNAADGLAANMLRRHASDWGCDLLVMGLYGRSRLSERLFGGVSHEFITDPPCPLLVSH